MGKLRTIVQEAIGLMRGHNWFEGFLGLEPRMAMLKNER